jgi:3-oxo-5-alpha-steroid 4-dehydrogenase 1
MAVLSMLVQLIPRPTSLWPHNGEDVYKLCQLAFLSTPLALPFLNAVQAPFGRFSAPSRFNVNGNLGWFLMEIVSPVTFLVSFLSQPLSSVDSDSASGSTLMVVLKSLVSPSLSRLSEIPAANKLLATLFVIHYFNRAVLNPLRAPRRSPMHLSVPIAAVFVNLVNGFLMGSWLGGRSPALLIPSAALDLSRKTRATQKFKSIASRLGNRPPTISAPGLLPQDSSTVLTHPLFLLGVAGWAVGFASNVYHDEILLDLRRPKADRVTKVMREDAEKEDAADAKSPSPKYGIPKGGLYKFVSYPNYLSECKSAPKSVCGPVSCLTCHVASLR